MAYKRKPIGVLLVTDTPPAMVKVAENRCRDMLHNMRLLDFDLMCLVVSAYLQGVHDAATVAFQNGFVPPGCEPEPFIHLGDGI